MNINQNKTPLLDAINKFIDTKPAYFRIPGHRMEKGISKKWIDKVGSEIFAYDVTETPITDDLHSPEGAILEAQKLLAQLYEADRSFFLVNGTTCGNEAMIISAALEGQKIMIARNAHKSAMMGLTISGAKPVYVMPEILDDWGIQGGITPEAVKEKFEEHPDCKALFIVSPSYYGICSDLEGIAKVCHEYGALLLVDEAHGGHMYFHDRLPKGALKAGADMCVQSFHKVTGALTQSSVMHINNQVKIDIDKLVSNLHLVQSTSPSYLLMTSLDCARYELSQSGEQMMSQAIEMAQYARRKINLIKGFKCMTNEVAGVAGISETDETRLVISAKELGITGFELDDILFNKFDVNMELSDYENVLAIITYANTKDDIDRLIIACEKICADCSISDNIRSANDDKIKIDCCKEENKKESYFDSDSIPEQKMTPRQAYFAESENVEWKYALGRVSAQLIAPYPPGIPVVYPGEIINSKVWNYVEQLRKDNRNIHGFEAGKNTIKVIV